MAVECGVAILTKIGEYLVSPITHQLRYLWHYNKNIEDFRNQLEILGDKRDDVQQSVAVARRNGEEIKANVENWLAKVDEIIAQAEELNERINANKRCLNGWCPDWSSMYKLSREVAKKASIVTQRQNDVPEENVSRPAPPVCVDLLSNRDFVPTESSKSTMDQIMELLLQGDACDIIGVYGMGGVGKTTLVKEVGKKAKEQKLFDHVVMVVVSQNPDFRKIQGQIADLLGMQLGEETDQGRAGRLYTRLKNDARILIILDDVWAKIALPIIGIHHGADHKGCKVIVTTRREHVCADMGTKRIRMSHLSPEESWNLFRENAGAIVDSSMLNDVAKKVVRECCGLPLSLVTVGRALHDKELEEWKSALQQLKKSTPLTMDEEEQVVFSCIKLSYYYIKTNEIKLLFLLCCLFPEDYEIRIEDLARFGMGKGLFGDADTMDEARSQAHERIRYLKDSCLLLHWSEVNVKMHDVVRDVAISIASKDKNISFLVRAGLGIKEWPNMQTFKHYTAISVMQNDINKLPGRLECPNLQILLLGENRGLEEIPDDFFRGMPELRVLDLSCNQVNPKQCHTILPHSFELLAQLRTLRLNGCKLGNSISVLGKLKKLEILSLTDSYIEEFPKEIGELSNLRLLDLTRCQVLQLIPPNVISRLTKLEELCMGGSFQEWAVEGIEEEKSKACLSELKSLPHLLILSVAVKNIECYPRQLLLENLVKFDVSIGAGSTKLYPTSRRLAVGHIKIALSDGVKVLLKSAEVFDLTEDSVSEIFDVHGGGPIGLKELRLTRCDNMLSLLNSKSSGPSVIFTSLETLNLEYVASMSFICDSYASFTNLRELSIERCRSLKYLFPHSVAESFLQLKRLGIKSCEKLERIIEEDAEEGASSSRLQPTIVFPNLESVDLGYCPLLTSLFPVGTKKEIMLPKLESLTIYSCEKLERIIEEDAEEGASSSRLQPTIVFPNLEVVDLKNCPLLTSLFPVATEKEIMLPKLEHLCIKSCEKLERIIEKDGEEGASSSRHQPIIVFPNLKYVDLKNCPLLTSLFPVATEKEIMLPKLERIIEEDAEEGASSSRLQPIIVFPNLESVFFGNCSLLTSLFPVATEKEIMLPKLKSLSIYHCEKLERIIEEDAEEGALSSRLQPTIVFPNLEEVTLIDCSSLTSLFPVATEKEIMLPKLRSLTICRCEKLERIIKEDAEEGASSSRLQPTIVFPNLMYVDLEFCPLLTSLFPVATEKEIMLPKLKSLSLFSCEKLERIIEEEDAEEGASSSRLRPTIVFPNLESVNLQLCPLLTSLFPVATEKEIMLPKLNILSIYSCKKLERIIEEDAEEGASSSRLQPTIVFPNLEMVELNDCSSLTSLFPVATEKEIMLPKLESLTIGRCEKLEKIIKEDAEEGASSSRLQLTIVFPNLMYVDLENCPLLTSLFPVATEEEITLPKLKFLRLVKLRSLKRVFSDTSSVDMLCLETLVVKWCPMMEFGNDLRAYGLRSAPELKTLEVDGPIWDGEAIQNLFSRKV